VLTKACEKGFGVGGEVHEICLSIGHCSVQTRVEALFHISHPTMFLLTILFSKVDSKNEL
jgi:hypothetical protein